jgi:hypothetical protein
MLFNVQVERRRGDLADLFNQERTHHPLEPVVMLYTIIF